MCETRRPGGIELFFTFRKNRSPRDGFRAVGVCLILFAIGAIIMDLENWPIAIGMGVVGVAIVSKTLPNQGPADGDQS